MTGGKDAGSPGFTPARAFTLSTADIPANDRAEWLREVIGREYADVEITPPRTGDLFNEMTITPWRELQLSSIRSHEVMLTRRREEPRLVGQDAYFAVVLLSGRYHLQQDGREAVLEPGDIALYDATRLHHIECRDAFAKLIVSIPRSLFRERVGGLDRLTATTISGREGLGAVASSFIRTVARQSSRLPESQFEALSSHALDLLSRTFADRASSGPQLARSSEAALAAVKALVEEGLKDPGLSAAAIARRSGLSARYINRLFAGEDTSLMRYVLHRRLERARAELTDPARRRETVAEIGWRWGFGDPAHFSRAFRAAYGRPPSACRPRP